MFNLTLKKSSHFSCDIKNSNFFFYNKLAGLIKNSKSYEGRVNNYFWDGIQKTHQFLSLKHGSLKKIFPLARKIYFNNNFKPYYKFFNKKFSLKNLKLKLAKKYLFYLRYIDKITFKIFNFKNSFKISLFSLEILGRYYIYLGYNKINLNSYWKKYIIGEYYNISIINLNYTYNIFKLQNNVLFKLYLKNLNFCKLFIFDSLLEKKFLFEDHNCYFSSNYFANSWYSGYLTNPLLRYEVKNKKNFFKNFKIGGVPSLVFFTHINKDAYLNFLNEFFLLKIPIFGLVDTNHNESFVDYPILTNTKNKFSRIFYLKVLSKLLLNVKFSQQKQWLFLLKNYYLGFIFRLNTNIKKKRLLNKKIKIKSLYARKKEKIIFKVKKNNFQKKEDKLIEFSRWYFSILKFFWKKNKNNYAFILKRNIFRNEKLFNYIDYVFRKKRFTLRRNLLKINLNKPFLINKLFFSKSSLIKKSFFIFRFFYFFLLKKKKLNFKSFFKNKKSIFILFYKFLNKFFFRFSFNSKKFNSQFFTKLRNLHIQIKQKKTPKKYFFKKKKKNKWKK